jgi:hypothetical protein
VVLVGSGHTRIRRGYAKKVDNPTSKSDSNLVKATAAHAFTAAS